MRKEKLIFIYPKLFTFIKTEIGILSDHYEIISVNQNWENRLMLPVNFIKQLIFLLFNIYKTKIILISFGGYSSFLPALLGKMLGKKIAIVVHGTDCVSFNDINYGNLRSGIMKYFIGQSYKYADIILPVSDSLVYTENTYYSDKIIKLGYSHHLVGVNTPYKTIPNGLVIKDWIKEDILKVPHTFITVMTGSQFFRKGGDLIIETARSLTDSIFYFAGIEDIPEISDVPKNIICLGRLSPEELRSWYSKSQFYLQLSNFEGFGVAICEAMLCHCVPIVANVNFLPTIVGEAGFVLNKRDSGDLKQLISKCVSYNLDDLGHKSNERIKHHFSSDIRKDLLINTLKDL